MLNELKRLLCEDVMLLGNGENLEALNQVYDTAMEDYLEKEEIM